MMDFVLIIHLLPDFGHALVKTLLLVITALAGGLVIGFIANALRVLCPRRSQRLYAIYTSVWRGTPFLVQLFIVYFGLPAAGVTFSPFAAAAITLSIYCGAYCAEIFRGCWNTIPRGQIEAALVMGISRRDCFIRIELPQALRLSLPLLANQSILTFKESALASIITYPELTMVAGRIVAEQFVYVEPYLLLAATYWTLAILMQSIGGLLQRHTGLAKEAP
jgi:polar amino acid transport system permease protein